MRVAVTYENGTVFQHFGHTAQFKLYDIENGIIKETGIIDTNGSGHGALADFLKNNHVQALICGGIGEGARNALSQAGIQLYGGVTGDTDQAVHDLIADKLDYNPDVVCNHHDGHDHGGAGTHGKHGGHNCGEHNCGEHGTH